ncbi:cyr [Drosophila busckii]|uniref:Cyr n=2 Tax=Drosophila busckii TaxID=30019 RepID=A0A0M4EM14_DROBS|nr:cyr [Drosophila busckii]
MQIQTLQVNCTRELLDMQLTLNRNFRGVLYAKDFPLECRTRGQDDAQLSLRIPTSGCGVRAEPLPDGGMEYTVRIMLQMEQKLRQSTDILKTVRCQLPAQAMGMTLPLSGRDRNARMRALAAAAAVTHTHMETPHVRIWLELGGPHGAGSVEVGVATTLTVRAIVPGNIGVRVVDCAALDGLGESTQQLLDARGCPIDEQVMPALHTRHKPAEEGWSKQHEEDLVERTFMATFPAFKFPDRERLHVSCGVQLCKGKCPNLNCRLAEQPLQLNMDQHLARIEVFNSLAVTAPQIEVDRLRYDRRYNMSVDEYGPHVRPLPSEGTLCLSISKLALSFCILGSIFLVAIIVAICSLIRSRRRRLAGSSGSGSGLMGAGTIASNSNSSSRLHRAEICTSMFSSSSESAQSAPRFAGKFLMPLPYYPNTLPYGRVY